MSIGYRKLLERPFRRYARFDGRARRPEFWLFVLVFILVTECSWLIGFGAVSLVTGGTNGYANIDASSLTSGTIITHGLNDISLTRLKCCRAGVYFRIDGRGCADSTNIK